MQAQGPAQNLSSVSVAVLLLFYLFTKCEAVHLAGSFRYQSHLQGAMCDQDHLPKSLLMLGTPTCPKYPLRTGCPVATQGGLSSAPSRYQTLSLPAEGPADIADPLPPAGAAHSGLPQGQDLSLHCGAPGTRVPSGKGQVSPLFSRGAALPLSPMPQSSGLPRRLWMQSSFLASPGLGWALGRSFNGGTSGTCALH